VFHNPDRRLTPLFVRLRLPGTAPIAVLVEDRAVGTDLDRRYVLVVGADKDRVALVTLGPLTMASCRPGGLKEGELVM
jgi:hypothetical protein